MGNRFMTDKEIERTYGMRQRGGTPLFSPQELGYRCPCGHSNLTWSEFKKHIWCFTCKMDYHSFNDCIVIFDTCNPKFRDDEPQAKVIHGITNFKPDGNTFNDIPYCDVHEILLHESNGKCSQCDAKTSKEL